jgi:threonine dehydratase
VTTVRHVPIPTSDDLEAARVVAAERLAPTPLVAAPALGERVLLKLETFQPTGSFKVRGALAALSQAPPGPVVTASAGNAGLGVAWAATELGREATIVVSTEASPAKVAALRALPVTLVQHGAGYDEAERHALALSAEGATFVSAYNDTHVIAGQASLGAELEHLDGTLTVIAPLGGGGLASGIGLWASSRRDARVIAVHADASPAFSAGLAAGGLVHVEVGKTLADGLAGNIEPGAATFEIVRDHVECVASVSEAEIEEGIRFLARAHGVVAEGAGAAGVAALLVGKAAPDEGTTVVLVTGRNIALPRLAAVLAGS